MRQGKEGILRPGRIYQKEVMQFLTRDSVMPDELPRAISWVGITPKEYLQLAETGAIPVSDWRKTINEGFRYYLSERDEDKVHAPILAASKDADYLTAIEQILQPLLPIVQSLRPEQNEWPGPFYTMVANTYSTYINNWASRGLNQDYHYLLQYIEKYLDGIHDHGSPDPETLLTRIMQKGCEIEQAGTGVMICMTQPDNRTSSVRMPTDHGDIVIEKMTPTPINLNHIITIEVWNPTKVAALLGIEI